MQAGVRQEGWQVMEKIYRLVFPAGVSGEDVQVVKLYTTKSRAKAARTWRPGSRLQETQVAWQDLKPVNNAGTNP